MEPLQHVRAEQACVVDVKETLRQGASIPHPQGFHTGAVLNGLRATWHLLKQEVVMYTLQALKDDKVGDFGAFKAELQPFVNRALRSLLERVHTPPG